MHVDTWYSCQHADPPRPTDSTRNTRDEEKGLRFVESPRPFLLLLLVRHLLLLALHLLLLVRHLLLEAMHKNSPNSETYFVLRILFRSNRDIKAGHRSSGSERRCAWFISILSTEAKMGQTEKKPSQMWFCAPGREEKQDVLRSRSM